MKFDATITLGQLIEAFIFVSGVFAFAFKYLRAFDRLILKVQFLSEMVDACREEMKTLGERLQAVEQNLLDKHVNSRRSTSISTH